MTITTVLEALPAGPQRSDPATFADKADAWNTAMETKFQPQMAAVITETNSTASTINADAITATTQAGIATAQAANASASASSASASASTATTQASNASASASSASASASTSTTQAGIATTKAAEASASAASIAGGPVASVNGRTGIVTLTKSDVSLSNVDNTDDTSKPVSTAQQAALDLKAPLASPTFTGTPAAPTASAGTNTTQLATTAHVFAERSNAAALTNKTVTDIVYTITDGASVDLDPANGGVQTWTLGASRTATASSFASGQSMILGINDGTNYAVTFPTITWSKQGGSGTAPTLNTSVYTWVVLWKVGSTLYGSYLGDA